MPRIAAKKSTRATDWKKGVREANPPPSKYDALNVDGTPKLARITRLGGGRYKFSGDDRIFHDSDPLPPSLKDMRERKKAKKGRDSRR